jgi:hypothetical protein
MVKKMKNRYFNGGIYWYMLLSTALHFLTSQREKNQVKLDDWFIIWIYQIKS